MSVFDSLWANSLHSTDSTTAPESAPNGVLGGAPNSAASSAPYGAASDGPDDGFDGSSDGSFDGASVSLEVTEDAPPKPEKAEKLTPKQEKAIANLLLTNTIKEAATKTGVSEPTLLRWLRQPLFSDAYRDARRETVLQAVAHLSRASSEAVITLRLIARDKDASPSARVTACKAILDYAFRGVEIDDLAEDIRKLKELGHEVLTEMQMRSEAQSADEDDYL